ncbi:MAG: glycosyltransferase family 4 protein [Candidatus Yanofskybacteria bacterium]|nr:glycosyltransferase family 4 protein [Candidatus Yanofskybacteria bacterium]
MKGILIVTQKVDENDQLLGFFIEWLKRFSYKFEKITVICLEKGRFDLPENVRVLSLGKESGASRIKQLSTFCFLITALRKDYDAVLVHMNPIWVILGGFWWRMMKKKIFFWYTSGGVTAKLKLAEKFANTIFTASSESFRLPSKKIIVTGHGIDTEVFRPATDIRQPAIGNKIKILSVGRIAPVKNYETLIDAAKILRDRSFNFSVTMIGEAPLERDRQYLLSIKDKIKNLKLENYFTFTGKINHRDLVSYYQLHDIFIHLSKTGSLDKTILEAMACGMRVLSSNDASKAFLPADVIFNNSNPDELAEKILAQDKSETDSRLRDYVIKNHNLDRLIDKISGIIKS